MPPKVRPVGLVQLPQRVITFNLKSYAILDNRVGCARIENAIETIETIESCSRVNKYLFFVFHSTQYKRRTGPITQLYYAMYSFNSFNYT